MRMNTISNQIFQKFEKNTTKKLLKFLKLKNLLNLKLIQINVNNGLVDRFNS